MIELIIIILLIILILYNISISIKEGFNNDSCTPISASKVNASCERNRENYNAIFLEKETKVNKINTLINTITEKQTILSTDMCPEESIGETEALISELDTEIDEDELSNTQNETEGAQEQLSDQVNEAEQGTSDTSVVLIDALNEAGQ